MDNDSTVSISKDNMKYYAQLTDEATTEYYAWLKQILTLASGSLTVLVALRNQILPADPKAILLLQLSWLLFAAAIILALFALRGQHILLFHTARDLYQAATNPKIEKVGMTTAPKIYSKIGQATPWIFVSAVVALALFGIVNLIPVPKTIVETPKTPASISENPSNKQNVNLRKP